MKRLVLVALLLAGCSDPNRVAGTSCEEPRLVHNASIDDVAAFIAADPVPPCYYLPPQPSRAPRYNWPGL